MPTKKKQQQPNSARYVIVRAQGAGVFAGELVKRTGTEVEMRNVRRLWYWAGAASLSELAVRGTSRPNDCKFPVTVPSQEITGVLEVLDCTPEARRSIELVKEWSVK